MSAILDVGGYKRYCVEGEEEEEVDGGRVMGMWLKIACLGRWACGGVEQLAGLAADGVLLAGLSPEEPNWMSFVPPVSVCRHLC